MRLENCMKAHEELAELKWIQQARNREMWQHFDQIYFQYWIHQL